jgi:hypothetical protein
VARDDEAVDAERIREGSDIRGPIRHCPPGLRRRSSVRWTIRRDDPNALGHKLLFEVGEMQTTDRRSVEEEDTGPIGLTDIGVCERAPSGQTDL